jgi:thiol-disulfide isomerase/thioredoxin
MNARSSIADRVALTVLLPAVFLLSGCEKQLPPEPAIDVPLRTVDAAELARTVENHRGKVVLIDYWATWCEPCVELFPHAVELQRRWGNRGLAVITVSLDDPASTPTVRRFLGRQGAITENLLSTYGVGSAAFTALKIKDGALPHVQLYDRQGRLQQVFNSGGKPIDPHAVARAVDKLLGE